MNKLSSLRSAARRHGAKLMVLGATALPIFADGTMPDPAATVTAVNALAISAAVLAAAIVLWVVGKRLVLKLVK
jgi:hypothetical protein